VDWLLWLLYGFRRHLNRANSKIFLPGDRAVTFADDYEALFDRLDDELRTASRPTSALLAKVIATICSRILVLNKSGKTAGIDRLIESGAWADSALALVELELPLWKVRRIAHEGGEWFCSLSRTPNLPVEFDDSVDTSHEVLAIAVLRALVEARRRMFLGQQTAPNVMQENDAQDGTQLVAVPAGALCCDNFA
jgi:hypothetical protein